MLARDATVTVLQEHHGLAEGFEQLSCPMRHLVKLSPTQRNLAHASQIDSSQYTLSPEAGRGAQGGTGPGGAAKRRAPRDELASWYYTYLAVVDV